MLDERYKNKRSTAFSVERLVEERKETMGNIEEKKQTAEDIELTGKVILDDESYRKVYDAAREEVIEDIRKIGTYGSETKRYLEECNCREYILMIRNTIDAIMAKEADEKSNSSFKERDWTVLKAIHSVLLIRR